MAPHWLVALLVMSREAFSARRDAHLRFLKLRVELMPSRLPGNRVIFDPTERRRLTKIGAEFGHAARDTLSIVSVKTYRRWRHEEKTDREVKKVGRPRIAKSLREMIIQLARENTGRGVIRVLGELKKLERFEFVW